MRAVRILAALLFPVSGHFAAGRYRRAAAWVATFLVADLLAAWIGMIPVLAVWLASIVDAAIIAPRPGRGAGPQLLAALVAACLSVLVQTSVRTFWAEPFKIPSAAMIPTLEVGDHLLVDKRARTPGRGEVVVFKFPKEPDKDFIKRVVAVAGDTIEIAADGALVLNGKPVPRQHVDGPCEFQDYLEETGSFKTSQCDAWDETLDGHTYRVYLDRGRTGHPFPPVTVSSGYYVLGDNRDNSHDSRYWGDVPPDHVRGTARIIWFSYGPGGARWKRINHRVR